MDARIARVTEKLTAAQALLRTAPRSPGDEQHDHPMNAPLPEDVLRGFEAEQGILLPEDYRAFLMRIGNGGAGPYAGVLPLADWADVAGDDYAPCLRLPCPLSPDQPRTEDWLERLPPSVAYPFQGTIAIGHQGTSYHTLLVVCGPARGRVVYVDEAGQPPYFPENADFLSWYERWLDELLAGYDPAGFGFGFGVPGTEEELLRALAERGASPARRAAVLSALLRLPRLTDGATQAIVASLGSNAPEVRARASAVAGHFTLSGSRDAVRALLHDHHPAVRAAALVAHMQLPPLDWGAVYPLLRDLHGDLLEDTLVEARQAGDRKVRQAERSPEDPDLATALNRLSLLLQALHDYGPAQLLCERALAIQEAALGPDHPETAACLNNLGNLYQAQRDYAAAQPLFERALAIQEAALGPDHPLVAASLNNLALLLQELGDLGTARSLFERSLAIRENTAGPDDLDTAAALCNLAQLLEALGDHATAQPLLVRAEAIQLTRS